MRRKLAILLAFATVALGWTTAAPAEARLINVPSQIDLASLTVDGASGSVSTARQACRGQRTVRLYLENTWSYSSIPTSNVWATARTAADGSWQVAGPLPQGLYYAVVEQQRVQKNKHLRLLCGEATSGEKYI
jgi:hypothetical protein